MTPPRNDAMADNGLDISPDAPNGTHGTSRRQFVVGTGAGLLVGLVVGGGAATSSASAATLANSAAAGTVGPRALAAAKSNLNAFVQIGTNELVTIYYPAAEMGQGTMSGLAQIVAEELKVSWSHVRVTTPPANLTYANPLFGSQLTGGSTAVNGYYDALRKTGAAAREMLKAAAAARFAVPVSSCVAANGAVSVTGTAQTATYGSLAAAAATMPVPANPPLTDPAQFILIGTSVPRVDIPVKTRGAAIYGIDVVVPGMVYAAIKHCPSIGGTLAATPVTPAGALAVVNLDNAFAVIANDTWTAIRLSRQIVASWSIPISSKQLTSSIITTKAKALMATGTPINAETVGDVTAGLAGSKAVVDLTYSLPYVPHATMEVLNATASVTATSCEIWAPTQGQTAAVATAAALTGLPTSAIKVHTTFLGGGLGRKFEVDFIAQAVRCSMAVGKPVKLTWTREEDFSNDQYRPMALVNIKAGVDNAGRVTAFSVRNVSPSILGQRGWIGPGQVDSQAVEGAVQLPYAFGSRKTDWVTHPAGIPVGFWRSVGHSINAFAVECAIDELAAAAGADPVAFRLRLLAGDAKSTAVLQAAATLGRWGTALPAGHARGVAFHQSFGTTVAQVVEISKPTATSIKVHNVACAIDCGQVINPDSVLAQMQGGIAHGLGATLFSQISFNNGVSSVKNFEGYRVLKMKDMPRVQVTIMPSTGHPSGAGEPGVPPVAPAVANAYFALTGVRLRALPLKPA